MSRRSATADVFAVIADPTRRGLLDLLGRGDRTVLALASHFAMTVSAVSQHLSRLRTVGLVRARKVGRERVYRLDPAPLKRVADWVAFYERFRDRKLDALGRHLDETSR
jgi:DNA-binding transcriptional ArsR family regulator